MSLFDSFPPPPCRHDLTESTTKEFDNPTYGTSDTLPTRQGNGKSREYEEPTYDIANATTPTATDGLVYDTPDNNDRGPNGAQGGVMYSTLDEDRSGPEGPTQSRPRENVDMSGVEEYGKLRR